MATKKKRDGGEIYLLSRGVTVERSPNSREWYIYHTQRTGPWSWTPKRKLAGPFKSHRDARPEADSLNRQAPVPWDGPVTTGPEIANPLAFETINLIAGIILAAGAATVVGTMAASGGAGPTGGTGSTGSTGTTGSAGTTGSTDGGGSGGGSYNGSPGGNGSGGGGVPAANVLPPPNDEWTQLPANSSGGEVLVGGNQYLISVDASVAGKTFQSYLDQLGALGTIIGSWDVGQDLPIDWPAADSGTQRWRYQLEMSDNSSTILDASTETAYGLASWQGVAVHILGLNATVGTFTSQPGISYRFSVPPIPASTSSFTAGGGAAWSLPIAIKDDFSLDNTYAPGSQLPSDWLAEDGAIANTRYEMTCIDSSPTSITIPKTISVFALLFV